MRSNRRYKSPSKHKTWLFSSSPAPTMPVQRGFSLVANVECAADPERHEEAGGRSDQEGGVRGHPHHLLVRPSPGVCGDFTCEDWAPPMGQGRVYACLDSLSVVV